MTTRTPPPPRSFDNESVVPDPFPPVPKVPRFPIPDEEPTQPGTPDSKRIQQIVRDEIAAFEERQALFSAEREERIAGKLAEKILDAMGALPLAQKITEHRVVALEERADDLENWRAAMEARMAAFERAAPTIPSPPSNLDS